MARRTQYDLNHFRALVVKGKSKADIIAEMSIKNQATFKNLLMKLMVTDKKYYETKESKKIKEKVRPKVSIGKRNTLTLSSKILEGSEFGSGDAFFVKYTKNKITLTLVKGS